MTEWQRNFFIDNWSRAFWKRSHNEVALHFEGNRDVLLVGFDSEFGNNKSKNWKPWGSEFAQEHDINYLGFSSVVPDWYLNPWFADQIQALVDEKFFDRFSRVVFAGHSMGGHGALRFSQYVDGAYLAAFSPQATLQPGRAKFDDRYETARRLPWRGGETDASSFEYAADRSVVFYDPYLKEDRAHAEILGRSGAQLLRTYYAGHGSLAFLKKIGISDEIMMALCFDTLTPEYFYELFRHRRTTPWFRKSLESYFSQRGRTKMVTRLEKAVQQIEQEFMTSRFQPNAKTNL